MPLYFHTGSMAEWHWRVVYRVLAAAVTSDEEKRILLPMSRGESMDSRHFKTVQRILLTHNGLLNKIFYLRTMAFFKILLEKALGFTVTFIRFEFAKSRGAIHFHSLLYHRTASKTVHGILNKLLNAKNMEELSVLETEAATEVVNSKVVPSVTALHPAGLERTSDVTCRTQFFQARTNPVSTAQFQKVHSGPAFESGFGNVDEWPRPEGIGPEPSDAPMKTPVYELITDEQKRRDAINFANRCCLHCCSSYCLRGKIIGGVMEMHCRMGMGKANLSLKTKTDGKKTVSSDGLSTVNGITSLATKRDHPRLVQYSPTIARYWGANADVQFLLYALDDLPEITNVEAYVTEMLANFRDLEANELKKVKDVYNARNYFNKQSALESLINYIIAYACKGEISSTEAATIFKSLTNVPAGTSMTTVAMKLNMKILNSRNIASQEAVYLLQGLQLYKCTYKFTSCSVNPRYHSVEVDGGPDGVQVHVKQNKVEQYFQYMENVVGGEC